MSGHAPPFAAKLIWPSGHRLLTNDKSCCCGQERGIKHEKTLAQPCFSSASPSAVACFSSLITAVYVLGEKDKRYKHLLNCIKEQRERQRKTEGPRGTDFLSMLLLFLQLQPVIGVMLSNSTTFTRYCVDTVRCVLVQRRSGFCLCPGLGDNSWALLSGLSLTLSVCS